MKFIDKLTKIAPELVKVTPHNTWSLSLFTDIKAHRKQVDTITRGKPEPVNCRGQR